MSQPAPRALIAEDEPLLAAALQQELSRAWPGLQIVATVGDGLSAVRQALALQPELLFFDIRMPGQSGLDAAVELAEDWPGTGPAARPFPALVFVTAYDQYAVQAFEAQAIDYLLKPIQPARLQKTVQKLQQALANHAPYAIDLEATMAQLRHLLAAPGVVPGSSASSGAALTLIPASSGNRVHMVPVAEVLYFEAADKYVRVLTAAREFLIRTPLKELTAQLDQRVFWQIHRSTLVRADAITTVTRDEAGKLHLELKTFPFLRRTERQHHLAGSGIEHADHRAGAHPERQRPRRLNLRNDQYPARFKHGKMARLQCLLGNQLHTGQCCLHQSTNGPVPVGQFKHPRRQVIAISAIRIQPVAALQRNHHPEYLANAAVQLLRNFRHAQTMLCIGEQFQDINTLFQCRGRILWPFGTGSHGHSNLLRSSLLCSGLGAFFGYRSRWFHEAAPRCQPLTPPSVSPAIRCFCTRNVSSSAGMMISTAMAHMPAQSMVNCAVKSIKATGMVLVSGDLVSCEASANSFQLVRKAKIPAAAIPPRANGNSTFQKACQAVQPSIRAAWDNSCGTWRKNPSNSQMVNGTFIAKYTMMTPGMVSSNPSQDHMMNIGKDKATPGMARVSINPTNIAFLPRK